MALLWNSTMGRTLAPFRVVSWTSALSCVASLWIYQRVLGLIACLSIAVPWKYQRNKCDTEGDSPLRGFLKSSNCYWCIPCVKAEIQIFSQSKDDIRNGTIARKQTGTEIYYYRIFSEIILGWFVLKHELLKMEKKIKLYVYEHCKVVVIWWQLTASVFTTCL